MRVFEELTRDGYFWVPGDAENPLSGTLRVSDSGEIELELVGNFDKTAASFLENIEYKTILGSVEKEGAVTLRDCFYLTKNPSFGVVSKSLMHVGMLLSGVHYEEDEDILFNTFRFSVEGLDEWLSISGIKVENDYSKKSCLISYDPPKNELISLEGEIQLKFTFRWTLPGLPAVTQAQISQKAYIELHSENEASISEFISLAHKITSFLCFATDQIASIHDVSANSNKLTQELSGGKVVPLTVNVFYQSLPWADTLPKVRWFTMLFTYLQISDRATDILNKWLTMYELFETPLSLYFASRTGAYKFLTGKFLSLAQSLETFHRLTSSETLFDEEDYSKLVTELLDKCPADYKKWLKGKLRHSNEIFFSTRLQRIIDPLKNYFPHGSCGELLWTIADSRNYYTHYSADLKVKAASGESLWRLCNNMDAIFQLLLLTKLGFAQEEIEAIIAKCQSLKKKLELCPNDNMSKAKPT